MILFLLLLFVIFFSPSFINNFSVLATNEFEMHYDVKYEISSMGKVKVLQNISLVNKSADYYASQYALNLKGTKIENVSAYDKDGPLETNVIKDNEKVKIIVNFNKEIVGKNKSFNFTISYEDLDAAKKNGEILEVNIPRLSESSQIDTYQLTLAVPKVLGGSVYIKPSPSEQLEEGEVNLYRFTKEQLLSYGVNAIFGQFQVFDFNLYYFLENPYLDSANAEITLPPDTAFQQVIYKKIEPKPLNVRVDGDGNWLALYLLNPYQKLEILASGKARIFGEPQKNFPTPSAENLQKNLLPQIYWEADAPLIQDIAKNLKTPREIYNFVIKTLDYDFSRIDKPSERFGALKSLVYPKQATCQEFTDLFIALARANGIPAREITGFAYSSNEKLKPLSSVLDILHSWPEYWDFKKNIWVPIDPTWEKTTGGVDYFSKTDLNHFAFVIHGENSQTPTIPGAYKKEGVRKNIDVVFGKHEKEPEPQFEVKFDLPSKIPWSRKIKGWITIENTGSIAIYNLKINIETQGLILEPSTSVKQQLFTILPPFSSKSIELEVKPTTFPPKTKKIIVKAENKEFYYNIENNYFTPKQIAFFCGSSLFLGVLLILTRFIFYGKRNI